LPSMRGDDSEAVDRDRILMMQKLLNAAAEREPDPPVEQPSSETDSTEDTGHKLGIAGPKDNPDPHLAAAAALQDAAKFGMIGLIATMSGGDPNAPTVPW